MSLPPSAAVQLGGTVRGGQQAISGSLIQLYAAGTTGNGSAATPLISKEVRTDSSGSFDLTGLYTCPSSDPIVYIVAQGGNPGLAPGTNNSSIALLTALGPCGSLTSLSSISINEVTTIASLWPLAPYAESSAQIGFASESSYQAVGDYIDSLANISAGTAPGPMLTPPDIAPTTKLYTLADIFAACVNSSGGDAGDGTPCGRLFSYATVGTNAPPSDTVAASIAIAQNPSQNVANIYSLLPPSSIFQPTLASPPTDWTLPIISTPAAPLLSPASGSYASGQQVNIEESTPGASIYYTTDGSVPTGSSLLYSGPFPLTLSQTVNAVAIIDGSSSAVASNTYTINTQVSVSLTPASVTLAPSQNQVFAASVTGASNTAVTWSLSPAVGSISSSGVYTAPAAIATAQTVTVKATSVADPTKTASAAIALTLTPAVSVSLTPATVTLGQSQTEAFIASVANSSNTAVTWSLSPAVGSISGSGVYTAPATIATAQTVTVKATSVADATKTASAAIALTLTPAVSVSLTPASVTLASSQNQVFAASVTGSSNTAVTWSLSPAVGNISSSGVYTAPATISVAQTVTVEATSVADATKTASAAIALTPAVSVSLPAVSVSLTPNGVTLAPSQNQVFAASVTGSSNTAVTWSLSPAVGSISSSGLYSAPATISSSQTVTVTVTSVANPAVAASVSVSLTPPTGAMYYVSNSGNDTNNGTSTSSPWQTIAHVNAQSFKPGDSILFQAGGTWREQINNTWSGSSQAPLTFGSYGAGAMPIISGADVFSSWTTDAENLNFSAYTTAPMQVFRNGTRLVQVSAKASLTTGSWWLDTSDSRIYVFDNPAGQTMEADQRPFGFVSQCSSSTNMIITNLQFQETQTDGLYECGGGVWTINHVTALNNFHDGVGFADPLPGSSIIYTTVAYNGANGFELYNTPGLLVAYATAYNNVALPGNLFAAGIKFSPSAGTTNAIVEYSTAYSNGVGQAGVTGSGIWADTIGNGWIVRYNTVYNNNQRGIDIDADNYATVYGNVSYGNQYAGIMAYADGGPSMTGHQIYNNTVWGNGQGIMVQGPSSGSTAGGCENNSVTNNIVGASSAGPQMEIQLGCENPGTDGSGNVYTYNNFGPATSNFVQWGGNNFSTYAAWETAAGNCGTTGCSHSMEFDPMLTNPSGAVFTLQPGSPAIAAGVGGVDLGAIPYVAP